jgi:hypothetical protein
VPEQRGVLVESVLAGAIGDAWAVGGGAFNLFSRSNRPSKTGVTDEQVSVTRQVDDAGAYASRWNTQFRLLAPCGNRSTAGWADEDHADPDQSVDDLRDAFVATDEASPRP